MSINMTMPWISPKWMGFGLQSFLLWIQPTVVYEVLQHSWWVWIWIQSTIVEAQQLINNFWFVGSACQSNLQVQISALEVGAVPLLIRLVALDSSKQVQARALYALSSIIRHFPYAQKAFFDEGGISAFSQLFQTDSSELQKLQLKIITLLSDIITEKSMLAQHLQEQQDSLPLSGNLKWDLSRTWAFVILWLISIILKELSPEDALERRNSETKLSQYNSFDTEKIIVEQGFCNLIPRLLTQLKMDDDDHDVVEKVIQAMLPLRPHCQKDFLSVRPIISILTDRYVYFCNLHDWIWYEP